MLVHCKGSNTTVDLAHTFCAVCAAGIIDPRLHLRDNFLRAFLQDDAGISVTARMVIKYTDRGASGREHYRVLKAQKHANNAGRSGYRSVVARSDDEARY